MERGIEGGGGELREDGESLGGRGDLFYTFRVRKGKRRKRRYERWK